MSALSIMFHLKVVWRVMLITFFIDIYCSSKMFIGLNEVKLKARNSTMVKSTELCQGIEFNQVIIRNKCIPVVIRNRLCTGYCKSDSTPNLNEDMSREIRSCTEDRSIKVKVRLHCPLRRKKILKKRIKIVETCKCRNFKFLGWD